MTALVALLRQVAGDEERWARVALARVVEAGDRALAAAVAEYGPVRVLGQVADGTLRLPWVERYRARLAEVDLVRLRALGERVSARLVCPGDEEWPPGVDLLAELDGATSGPPLVLWVRGPRDLADVVSRGVAVVGSRAATDYGREVAAQLGFDLAERGVTVVSGAAYGIDGAAHRGALAAGGATVAVLGCGIDRAYPSGHDRLLRQIADEGLVLSESPPGAPPSRNRFLTRNRLIAVLSHGVVVVEAALRSGALNTASWAAQLSREVMAVPGPVTSPLSAGAHRCVIERNARLVTDAADVLELVGSAGEGMQEVRRAPSTNRDRLPAAVAAVLEALPARAPRDAGQLAVAAGVPLDAAIAALGQLQAEGWVRRGPSGWHRVS